MDHAKERNPSPDVKQWKNSDDIKACLGPLKKEKRRWSMANKPGGNEQVVFEVKW